MAVSSQEDSMVRTSGPAAASASRASVLRGAGTMGHGRMEGAGSGRPVAITASVASGSGARRMRAS